MASAASPAASAAPGRPVRRRRRRRAGSSTARPAAVASGFPDSVPAWYTGPTGRQVLHHVAAAAEGAASGRPPPITLPKHHRSGRTPNARAPPQAEAEPGDDLVEDQQRAGRVARGPQPFEEPGRRRDEAHVGGDRLDDHRGDVVVDLGHDVVGRHDGVGHRAGGHAGRARQAQGGHAAAAGGQQPVAVAVVAAGELDDAVAAGRAPRQPHRRHRRLGAARHEPHHLAARHPLADRLGQQHLALGRRAEGGAVAAARCTASTTAGWAWPRIDAP